MSNLWGKVLRLKVYIDSGGFLYNYTGKLSKTIVLTEISGLEHMFKPIKGFFKPLRISPPIERGRAQFPHYERRVEDGKTTYDLKPVLLKEDYVIEVGAPNNLVEAMVKYFKGSLGLRTRVKFENTLVNYVINDVEVFEPNVDVTDKVVVSSVSPAILSNPFTPNQQVRRFTANPSVVLWIPYLLSKGVLSHSRELYEKILELERCLSEHYTTKYRVVFINYDQRREPTMFVKAKYIVSSKDPTCRNIVKTAINSARVYGIGASRASGFGSVVVGGAGVKERAE